MANVFKDYIPEGNAVDAQGNGFKDYVPDPKPEFHPEPIVGTPPTEVVTEEKPVVEKPSKKKIGK